jgi:4-amino-4-deoxy-L-arabinose transferase-like glycosyltransferase
MVATRKIWEYGLLLTVALAIGLLVAAGVAFAVLGAGGAVSIDRDDLMWTILPAAAGLVTVVVTLDVGLRRLNRPRAKIGW